MYVPDSLANGQLKAVSGNCSVSRKRLAARAPFSPARQKSRTICRNFAMLWQE
jgi:hypothetical protein